MNDKIVEVQNKLVELESEKERLQNNLLFEWYSFLKDKGITKGGRIKVKDYNKITEGLFIGLSIQYDSVRPKIAKMKKDGTAHSTATIYCYSTEDIIIE